jgi:transcriptional regulator GlxA family with amidase domain
MGEPLRPDETLAVGIVLYDEVEELDFCGPFETFSVAAALSASESPHRERPAFTVFTAAGISAGIDMSLHVVEKLLGRKMAEETARMMEYRWNEGGE